jgi:hypothetical protein
MRQPGKVKLRDRLKPGERRQWVAEKNVDHAQMRRRAAEHKVEFGFNGCFLRGSPQGDGRH